jgi:ATP-dependent exoDNAse (exonuclease V) alpha subunit
MLILLASTDNFDHGYAVTSYSSQGLTAERVLVHADTSVRYFDN